MNLDKTFLLKTETKLPFVIVVPGGGYNHYGSKEQETIALKMNELGMHSAVLYYEIQPTKFPAPLLDLAEAVKTVRARTDEWKISSVVVLGFSAGGHLSGCLGAFWNSKLLKNAGYKAEEIRPDYLCLCYPVISSDRKICHEGSVLRLTENIEKNEGLKLLEFFGIKADSSDWQEKVRELISLEKHVTKEFPPVFMWHTKEDAAVPVANTLEMEKALKAAGVDYEYHLYNKGQHGLALGEGTQCEEWPYLFKSWLETKGAFSSR